MKTFRFVLSLSITLAIGIALNTKIGSIPPLGKFLSPFHGFWQNAENEAIDITSASIKNHLNDSVNIYYDELFVPHVYAQNDNDLYFAQGYITAYHRLWQMEFQIYSAEGRLSELLGGKLGNTSIIDVDRQMRRIGLKYAAQKSEEKFRKEEPELYAMLESYSEGINTYIESLSFADLPIEYKLLDYKPEKWTPLKCFLLISNMNNMLSRGERDLEHTNALKKWGREVFEILYPERPNTVDPIIPDGTTYDFEPIAVEKPDVSFPLEFTDPTIEPPNPHNGSNSFVVNGEKTANGRVILTNELDLSLNLPSIWYLMHLNAPSVNVMGATLPGAPSIIIGFNDSIAWGNTNARRDLVDWYYIQFKDDSREEYLYNENWVPTKKVIEEIKVRGSFSYYDTIIYTHHGPVVYDRNFTSRTSEITNLAMKWTAHEASKEVKALYLVNRARNYDEFIEGYSLFSGPPQNCSFGATNGDIAIYINGKFPVKWKEQGKFLMDGSNIDHEWKDYMPSSHNLFVKNPSRNFVSSANQHPADSLYPYYQYDYFYEAYRGRRLNDRLRVMDRIEVKDMMELQHDNFNYNASEILPTMLDSLDSASFTELEWSYYNKLKNWDFFSHPDLQAPSIYQSWWRRLNAKIWDEIDSSDVRVYRPSWYNTVDILKSKSDFWMVDNQSTDVIESTGDLYRLTFKETIGSLDKYLEKEGNSLLWYEYKNTTIRHLLQIGPFSKGRVKVGGNSSIVNAVSRSHGPSWRMVVELGDGEVNAWGVYPGSQSGNPGNPNYGHMIDDWGSGEYYKLFFKPSINASDEEINHSITLKASK